MTHRTDPDVERLWAEFHELVNVTSGQLHAWLMTEAAGEDGALDDSSAPPGAPETRRVLALLAKRKVDLTPGDVDAMRTTVEDINRLRAARPPAGESDDRWRRDLLDLGHDPLAALR